MDLNIKDKRALVVAGGNGMGRAAAVLLAKEGAKVTVASLIEEEIASLLNEIGGIEKGHQGISLDLTGEGSAEKLFGLMKEKPDIIVHCLGGTLNIKDPLCPKEDWRKLWRLNLEVIIEINRLFLPEMKKKKWGRIVHISSLAGRESSASLGYSTIKAALNSYTKNLGRIMAKDGIVISAVMPGPILTKGGHWETIMKNSPDNYNKFVSEQMPVGRLGAPEEIANLIVFLCSDKASFCAGDLMPIDGGHGRAY